MKNVEKQIYIPITNFDLNVLHTILMIFFYGQYFLRPLIQNAL